jgi:GT2 family glycosyltransferase/glycosyltransferase involved in cell wall biosynthesis
MLARPTISVVVLNFNGRQDLEQCYASLTKLHYAADRLELILVDNASTDGSVDFIRRTYPDVKVVALPENVGFGSGNNAGAEAASGTHVVFLNNDMWVDPGLLDGFVQALAARPAAVAAAAKILNWDGTEFDFAGAGLHFSGMGYQEALGQPFDPNRFTEVRPILFACGGAMIVERQTFLDVGGFDGDFFIYYEDTDLGWRLWLLGHEVVFAPNAVVYHRHHGTMNAFADYRKRVLYKRNSMASAFKNYSEENVGRMVAAALLGQLDGIVSTMDASGRIDPAQFSITSRLADPKESVRLSLEEASTLVAVHQLVEQLPLLQRKRLEVQQRRKRSDDDLAPLFRWPFGFWPDAAPSTHSAVVDAFGLRELFAAAPTQVLVFSPDILPYPGLPTVGSGLRAWGLAEGLKACGHEVVISMPREAVTGREHGLPREVIDRAWDLSNFQKVIQDAAANVIIVCGWPVLAALPAEAISVPVVLDQPGPHFLERRYQQYATDEENRQWKLAALRKADYFTSSGERQHSYFARWLGEAGWTQDEIERRTASIPYSLSPNLPKRQAEDGLTFVYGGVFLPWQDPTTALETLVDYLDGRGDGTLQLYGGNHPISTIRGERVSDLYEALAQSSHVVRHDLIPYDELISSYCRAHVAVDLMARNPERELAFTTRTVVYLWCGLPVIYNDYSELSDYISRYDAGWTLDPTDVDGLRAVLDEIFTDPGLVARKSENAQCLVREELDWTKTVEPLDRIVRRANLRRLDRTSRPAPAATSEPSVIERVRYVYKRYGAAEVARKTIGVTRRRLASPMGRRNGSR